MAKVHIKRLEEKYGKDNIKGKKYQEILSTVIDQNTTNINNKVARLNSTEWEKSLRKITPKEKKFVIPDIRDVLPKRTIHLRKVAEQGKFISGTLRDKLTQNLRSIMTEFETKTGEPSFIRRRGITAGRINPKLIGVFEKQTKQVFENYVKRDKKLGMPKNIHTIAVTEVRSSINEIKNSYTDQLIKENPEIQSRKRWIHNTMLSKKPRRGHKMIDGQVVPFNEMFKVPRYKQLKGKQVRVGTTLMSHPHDPNAPIDQIIGCNCDFDIIVSRKRKG